MCVCGHAVLDCGAHDRTRHWSDKAPYWVLCPPSQPWKRQERKLARRKIELLEHWGRKRWKIKFRGGLSPQRRTHDLGGLNGLSLEGTPVRRGSLCAFCKQKVFSSAAAWETCQVLEKCNYLVRSPVQIQTSWLLMLLTLFPKVSMIKQVWILKAPFYSHLRTFVFHPGPQDTVCSRKQHI